MYNALGQRIEKDVWTQVLGSTVTTRFAYDRGEIWADLTSTNALQTRYVRGQRVLELLGRIAGGTAAWILADRMGSVRNVVDNTGSVIDTIGYDGYGNVTNESNPPNGGQYKYDGYRYDSETGFYRPDPTIGRLIDTSAGSWINRDPWGFGAGDANLYRYVGNSPILFLDPDGIEKIKVQMDAFINKRLGVWLDEPVPFSDWKFKTDERDFGGSFQKSRIRSWFEIESTEIGRADQVTVDHAAGRSVRGMWVANGRGGLRWETEAKTTQIKGGSETKNDTNGKCSTRVTVTASGNYHFYSFSPDIDYKFLIYFIITTPGSIITKIGFNHNSFPDYEVRIDSKVVYKYKTEDKGPGLWNLTFGSNVKGVEDGPTIRAKTDCCP